MPRPRRSRGSYQRSQTAKQRVQWDLANPAVQTVAAGGAFLINLDRTARTGPETIRRMLGQLRVAGATSGDEYGLGVTVVTNDALSATAVPDPLIAPDEQQGWYLWIAGSIGPTLRDVIDAFDIRTARRVAVDAALVLHFQAASGNTSALEVGFQARLLWGIV